MHRATGTAQAQEGNARTILTTVHILTNQECAEVPQVGNVAPSLLLLVAVSV